MAAWDEVMSKFGVQDFAGDRSRTGIISNTAISNNDCSRLQQDVVAPTDNVQETGAVTASEVKEEELSGIDTDMEDLDVDLHPHLALGSGSNNGNGNSEEQDEIERILCPKQPQESKKDPDVEFVKVGFVADIIQQGTRPARKRKLVLMKNVFNDTEGGVPPMFWNALGRYVDGKMGDGLEYKHKPSKRRRR